MQRSRMSRRMQKLRWMHRIQQNGREWRMDKLWSQKGSLNLPMWSWLELRSASEGSESRANGVARFAPRVTARYAANFDLSRQLYSPLDTVVHLSHSRRSVATAPKLCFCGVLSVRCWAHLSGTTGKEESVTKLCSARCCAHTCLVQLERGTLAVCIRWSPASLVSEAWFPSVSSLPNSFT